MVAEDSRRLPVVDGDRLVGILTVTDVVRAIARGEIDGDTEVGGLATHARSTRPTRRPRCRSPSARSGWRTFPYAVVLDDDAGLAGILTEVDVLAVARVVEGEASTGDSIAEQDSEWSWEGIKATGARYLPTRNVELPVGPVHHFMTADLVTVSDTRTAKEVAKELISNDIGRCRWSTAPTSTASCATWTCWRAYKWRPRRSASWRSGAGSSSARTVRTAAPPDSTPSVRRARR